MPARPYLLERSMLPCAVVERLGRPWSSCSRPPIHCWGQRVSISR